LAERKIKKTKMSLTTTPNQYRPRRLRRDRARALIADIAIGVLAFFVLLCVGLIVPPLWTTIVHNTEPKFALCGGIKSPLERLACEDTLSDGPPHSAKGATAPLGAPDSVRRARPNGP
jgi:hypothetical protein